MMVINHMRRARGCWKLCFQVGFIKGGTESQELFEVQTSPSTYFDTRHSSPIPGCEKAG